MQTYMVTFPFVFLTASNSTAMVTSFNTNNSLLLSLFQHFPPLLMGTIECSRMEQPHKCTVYCNAKTSYLSFLVNKKHLFFCFCVSFSAERVCELVEQEGSITSDELTHSQFLVYSVISSSHLCHNDDHQSYKGQHLHIV